MGEPVLASGVLGMRFGCGMKWTRHPCFRSILIVDVGGHEDLHFGPIAESASHHLIFYFRMANFHSQTRRTRKRRPNTNLEWIIIEVMILTFFRCMRAEWKFSRKSNFRNV